MDDCKRLWGGHLDTSQMDTVFWEQLLSLSRSYSEFTETLCIGTLFLSIARWCYIIVSVTYFCPLIRGWVLVLFPVSSYYEYAVVTVHMQTDFHGCVFVLVCI